MTQAKISLKKSSGKISLKKEFPALNKLRVEFSWKTQVKLDADASAFVCSNDAEGKPVMISPYHMVSYANPADTERAVIAGPDVRDGTGDKEVLTVDISRVHPDAKEIAFVLTIDESKRNGLNFGLVEDGAFQIFNDETNELLVDYGFVESKFTNKESLIHVASLFNDGQGWAVQAFGSAKPNADIYDAVTLFGGEKSWYE